MVHVLWKSCRRVKERLENRDVEVNGEEKKDTQLESVKLTDEEM